MVKPPDSSHPRHRASVFTSPVQSAAEADTGAHWCTRVAVRAGFAQAGVLAIPARAAIADAWHVVCGAVGISEDAFAKLVVTHARLSAAQWDRADGQALRLIPERIARQFQIFPLRDDDRAIFVATSDPNDLDAEQMIGFASGRVPVFEIATPTAIATAIDAGYSPAGHAERVVKAAGGDVDEMVRVVAETGPERVNIDEADAAPIISLANLILRDAVVQRASDVHIEPGRTNGIVRFRIDGVMREYLQLPMPVHNRVVSRIKVTGQLDIADRHRPQDGRCRVQIADKFIDLRISTVPTRESEKVVIRILDSSNTKRLDELDLPLRELSRIRRLVDQRDGIFIVTGPTGSGKTTTLYAALNEVAKGALNITTIEDPVEYELAGVTQIQADARRQVTFASALRAVLRQDPDVIFVGEVRDAETAEVSAHAALTGHLVLTTLHTNDAAGVVPRLVDLGLDRATIGSSLRGVLAQRLVRRLCAHCAEPYGAPRTPDEERLRAAAGVSPARRPIGCDQCGKSGYLGRIAVPEVIIVSESIAEMIVAGASHADLVNAARRAGTRMMLEVALEKAVAGDTSLEEVERVLGLGDASTTGATAVVAPISPGASAADASEAEAPPRVLVTDDDPVIRTVVASLLEKELMTVVTAADGESALQLLKAAGPFNLAILDLGLPTLDGREVLRAIRHDLTHRRMPVIVLTGSDDAGDEVAMMDEGADDYLRKPIADARFVARCRAAIRRSSMGTA